MLNNYLLINMKKTILLLAIFIAMMVSCKNHKTADNTIPEDIITKENRQAPDFSKGILTEEILWYFGRITAPEISPDGKTLLFGVKYFDYTKNNGNTELYTMPVAGGTPTQISTTISNELQAIWRPDGKKIAFLYPENDVMQIFEADPDGTNRTQITHSTTDINGFSYSPDGENLLYTKNVQLDPTISERYPDLPNANVKIYDDLMYRHWDSWADGSYAHLFIAPTADPDHAIDLLKDEKFHAPVPPFGGMEQAVWSHNGKKIAYCCKREKGKEFAISTNTDIFIYDLETKETINLTEENLGYDMNPVFSPNDDKIVWWSMETPGFESDLKHMRIYSFSDNTTKTPTIPEDLNPENFVWGNDNQTIYFLSPDKGTVQIFKYYEDEKGDYLQRITTGDHDYNSLCLADNQLIATMTTHQLPAEIFSINIDNGEATQLTFTNQDILEKIDMGKTVKHWIKTSDGQDMLTWVILPPGFDSTKTYPTLLYCEGGPQSPVSQFFSYRWNFAMMAAHGYIVVAPNRRGLPGFGKEWNDEISRDYGGQCMLDYLSAIDYFAKEPYVDQNHLGAVGASFGGYSVYWLAGHHQKRFKAFIAHCGMFNFESWYGTTEELFFANHDIEGNYWQQPTPKSYSFSPHRFVGNWDTPILVIHGGNDFRIPYTEGMQAFDVAQMQGIPSRFLFFPDETHFVTKPQNAILWQREFFRFLDEYLKL